MTLHEAAGKSGTVDLYERFLDNCNDEMSIAVLGNTLTTKSDTNGTQALGTVQAKEQMKITEDDIQFILDLLNYEPLRSRKDIYVEDNVHMNPEGYQIFGEMFRQMLKEELDRY